MNRLLRYGISLLLAGIVTGGVAVVEYRSLEVLAGIFVLYSLGTTISLRYPFLVRSHGVENRLASGMFGAGVTFGGFALAEGQGGAFQLDLALLGLGLGFFGLATGVWMADTANRQAVLNDSLSNSN